MDKLHLCSEYFRLVNFEARVIYKDIIPYIRKFSQLKIFATELNGKN